jgi:hypothetical protein
MNCSTPAALQASLMMLLDATQTENERLHEWAARTLRALLEASADNRRLFAQVCGVVRDDDDDDDDGDVHRRRMAKDCFC